MFQAIKNLAAQVVERFNLEPPVDIRALVENHTDLEYCDWPYEACSGIAILSGDRPKVFIRNRQWPRRERFTLAHEFGHVMIGWHVNAIDCKPSGELNPPSDGTFLGINQEREANEFASRVLLPDRSVEHFRTAYVDPTTILETVAQAEMSATAGTIAVSRSLLPGYVFLVPGYDRMISSEGTRYVGIGEAARFAIASGTTEHQDKQVTWFQLATAQQPDNSIRSAAEAKRCLQEIAHSHTARLIEGNIIPQVGGTFGAAVGRLPDVEAATLYGVLLYRFGTNDLAPLLELPEFRSYLAFKARERAWNALQSRNN